MRYLALDVGDERIGLALSDETGLLARPLAIVERIAGAASFCHIAELVAHYRVERLVVGMPYLPDGSRGKQIESTEAYVAGLVKHIDTPIAYWDERYSSEQADAIIAQQSHRRRKRKGNDDIAAAVILQEYLDHARQSSHGTAGGPHT